MQIPADLKRAVAKDAFVPLLSEGWFAAGVITALALGIVTFVFFGVVFFWGQPHAAPTLVPARCWSWQASIGTAGGLAGLRIHAWYQAAMRATGAQRRRLLHLAVAGHRLLVAALFLIFGLSALWVAWFVSPLAGVVAVVVFALELVAGTLNVPNFLSLLCGRSVRFTQRPDGWIGVCGWRLACWRCWWRCRRCSTPSPSRRGFSGSDAAYSPRWRCCGCPPCSQWPASISQPSAIRHWTVLHHER